MPASQAVAVVLGGLLPTAYGLSTYSTMSGVTSLKRRFKQSLGGMGGYSNVVDRAIMRTLQNDAAVGTSVTNNRFAVSPMEELGGQRPIVSYPLINRNSTVADQAEYRQEWFGQMYMRTWRPNPPANLDRNPLGTR